MCGIFAYLWENNAQKFLIDGLKNLEYRWYDSAGICLFDKNGQKITQKALWKVSNLAWQLHQENTNEEWYHAGIAHTRWATHGWVTLENCHPHNSQNNRFHLVHNGIIENYLQLKKNLIEQWYSFYWDTDSEVVAKLLEEHFEKNLETTVKKIIPLLTWAYALAIMDSQNPNEIIAIKLGSPLVVGIKWNSYFLSSDANALANVTDRYIPIDDKEMVILRPEWYTILASWQEIQKESIVSQKNNIEEQMWDFEHFMLKEIFEIPHIIENVLWGRINFEKKEIKSNSLENIDIHSIKKIEIIASGTSFNAGLTGAYLFEELSDIPTQVHISTEFKYKKQFIDDSTLYIFISQSGETADSLECLKMVKNKWGKTFWIVNVVGSSIARMCDYGLYTHSGVEIGVAATKSFIGQLLTIIIISLYFWHKKDLDYTKYTHILSNLSNLKDDIQAILLKSRQIETLAKKYSQYTNMFFLGRNLFYPIAMEWSLKCKEITYHHTESYSAWELKHGPLSLIDENFPTLLLNPQSDLYEKNISTLKEITARNGKIIWVISSNDPHKELYNDTIEIGNTNVYNSLFTSTVALQLFAYYMALNLGREIDKPRNLAKSVTVE